MARATGSVTGAGLGAALLLLSGLSGDVVRAQAAQGAAAGVTTIIAIDGGNAFVFSDGSKRVDVGPVKKPAGAADDDFNAHPMYLRLDVGTVDPNVQEDSGFAVAPKKWALAGHEVWACPDGSCPTTNGLVPSPDRGPIGDRCNPTTTTDPDLGEIVDNMYYLPDLLKLHGASGVPEDWASRLEGRLVLASGRLVVAKTHPCYGMRWYWKHRALPDGVAGLKYVAHSNSAFELKFKNGNDVKRVRLLPTAGQIKLSLTMDEPSIMVDPGHEVRHFQQFYELLPQVWKISRIKLSYKPPSTKITPQYLSPGSECPGGRFGGP